MSIFCDLSKAFDVISRTILIKKLEYYGIRGIVKNWLINYLSDRTQYVEIENNASSVSKIKCGVPQGSILGPLLYLIYVNDIGKCTEGNVLSFADDTSLVLSHQNPQTLYLNANLEINKLYNWFCANNLSLNAGKTKYIVIREPYDKSDITGLSLSNRQCIWWKKYQISWHIHWWVSHMESSSDSYQQQNIKSSIHD